MKLIDPGMLNELKSFGYHDTAIAGVIGGGKMNTHLVYAEYGYKDYEWATIAILYDEGDDLFLVSRMGGCSCNSPQDDLPLGFKYVAPDELLKDLDEEHWCLHLDKAKIAVKSVLDTLDATPRESFQTINAAVNPAKADPPVVSEVDRLLMEIGEAFILASECKDQAENIGKMFEKKTRVLALRAK